MQKDYERTGKIVIEALRRKESLCIYRHICGVNVSAEFSDDRKFRYLLDIQKNQVTEGKTVCAIMQNPSYAYEDIADKSVNLLEHLIFDGKVSVFYDVKRLIVVNQFAFVRTEEFQGESSQIGTDNDRYLEKAISEAEIVLIAWGASNKYRERISLIKEILNKYPGKVLFATNKHPSRGTISESFITKYKLK
jgi:hypothetical protein